MDPALFHYFVESTDRWGNPTEAGQPVECKVLDGVLPLRDHQQGYGGTQAVYNTQDKQVYFQHEVIARGTVIMRAEGETEKVYEQVFPPPQQVNGVRHLPALPCLQKKEHCARSSTWGIDSSSEIIVPVSQRIAVMSMAHSKVGVGCKQFCVGKNEGRRQKFMLQCATCLEKQGVNLKEGVHIPRVSHEQVEIVYLDLDGPISEKISSFRYCSP